MHTSIWYHCEDKCPKKSGHYLAYKLPTLGDDEEGYGVYYWNDYYTEWRESMAAHSSTVQVSIWAECPVHNPDNHMPMIPVPAEIDAWKKVLEAIEQYNIVRALVQ